MSAYPKLQSEPVSIDQFFRKIVLLCDRHDVAWGTPESLAGFMRSLKEDSHLAMDFWSVVAQMSDEGSGLGPEMNRQLGVIVEGVTGRTVAEVRATGPVEKQAVSELASLLSGEDIWSPLQKSVKPEEKHRSREGAQRSSQIGKAADSSSKFSKPLVPASIKRPVSEVAERPASVSSPAQAASLAAPSRRDPDVAANEASTSREVAHNRVFLEPEPLPAEPETVEPDGEPFHPEPDSLPADGELVLTRAESLPEAEPLVGRYEPVMRVPLAEYSEAREGRKGVITIVVLAIIGVAGVVLITRGSGDAYRQRVEAVIQSLWDKMPQRGQAPSTPPGNTQVQGDNAAGVTANEQKMAGGESGAVPAEASSKAAVKDSSVRPVIPPTEPTGETARLQDAAPRGPVIAGVVQVPAEVMRSHLISSRVPVYPEAARAKHAEGPVVMQGVVTKDGVVGHLHVISGDPSLRAAATAAVAMWRYRPYMLNGDPVDVSTTISVDFPTER
jgi:TonB family protein